MARRIYSIVIAVALGLGFYLNIIKETHSKVFLIVMAGIIFTCLSVGIHGLIAHSLPPEAKGGIFIYPLLMGFLWGSYVLFVRVFYHAHLLSRFFAATLSFRS